MDTDHYNDFCDPGLVIIDWMNHDSWLATHGYGKSQHWSRPMGCRNVATSSGGSWGALCGNSVRLLIWLCWQLVGFGTAVKVKSDSLVDSGISDTCGIRY